MNTPHTNKAVQNEIRGVNASISADKLQCFAGIPSKMKDMFKGCQ
jgi:hypothetical protein